MHVPSTKTLVRIVAVLSILEVLVFEAWHAWLINRVPAFMVVAAIVLNFAVSAIGLRTTHRAWWVGYTVTSLVLFVLISAATPLAGLWMFGRVAPSFF